MAKLDSLDAFSLDRIDVNQPTSSTAGKSNTHDSKTPFSPSGVEGATAEDTRIEAPRDDGKGSAPDSNTAPRQLTRRQKLAVILLARGFKATKTERYTVDA